MVPNARSRSICRSGSFLTACLLSSGLLSSSALAQTENKPKPFDPNGPSMTLDELQKITGGPTRVTLKADHATVHEITRRLLPANVLQLEASRVVNSLYRPFLGADRPTDISVDWKGVPFWSASRELERLSGLRGQLLPLTQGFTRFTGVSQIDGRVVAETPFVKVMATRLNRDSHQTAVVTPVSIGTWPVAGQKTDNASLTLVSFLDPKLKVYVAEAREVEFETADGAKVPIVRVGAIASGEPGYFLRPLVQMSLPIPETLPSGTRLSSIKGKLRLTLSSSEKTWDVPDVQRAVLAKPALKINEPVVEGFGIEDGLAVLGIALKVPDKFSSSPFVFLSQNFVNVTLRDGRGRSMTRGPLSEKNVRVEALPEEGSVVHAVLTFSSQPFSRQKAVGPFALEWTRSTETSAYEVPFELRNVVVP